MTNSISHPIRRKHERLVAVLPVQSANGPGKTRDLSISGVYFELKGHPAVEGEVVFVLELQIQRDCLHLKCQGQVMRVEDKGEKTGFGVRILDSQLFMQSEAA